jgi:hypothetical protein
MKPLAAMLIASLLVLGASGADRRGVPKVGDRAPSGNLIIHVFQQLKSNRPLPVELTSGYGIMVFNEGDEAHPKPRFLLAVSKSSSIQNFSTVQDFETALAKLPRGAVLHKYDRCSIPTSFGLKFDWEQFESRCSKLGLTISDEPHGACTCPD